MKKPKSFRIKLWLYFVLFAALIFSVLWIMQTVFFQSFYDDMMKERTRAAAEKIAANSTSENISEIIDEFSLTNAALVFITDNSGEVIYSSDQFKRINEKNQNKQPNGKMENTDEAPDEKLYHGRYRDLPDGYEDFLSLLEASENGVCEISTEDGYICGRYIPSLTSDEADVLYISTMNQAMGSAVDIIRIQLLWGTLISIVIGFIPAWFIARSFSSPVAGLTEKAEHMAENDIPDGYRKGFCRELDELNEVLDETSDRLKQSRTFQRELLANVSHDLRTPLTMIKGYAEMIRDISRTDEKQCESDLEVIIRETDRLSAMVNEILVYSEMQSEGTEPETEETDLSALVLRVCHSFENLYAREGGQIEKDISKGIIVTGNSGRLERAVYNLLDNAVRHSGESKVIHVALTKTEPFAELRITDHGAGIPPEELENIWDRYYTYRQRNKQGVSGLGLAIVKQIVKMHHGSCYAESKTGKGSTFVITLPYSRHKAGSQE